jgi:hypothetical protein
MKSKLIVVHLIAAILLCGCAGITFKTVASDLVGWLTAANVLWTDVGLKKTRAEITTDLIAGGVSASTADEIVKYLGITEDGIKITSKIVASLDALNAAAK